MSSRCTSGKHLQTHLISQGPIEHNDLRIWRSLFTCCRYEGYSDTHGEASDRKPTAVDGCLEFTLLAALSIVRYTE